MSQFIQHSSERNCLILNDQLKVSERKCLFFWGDCTFSSFFKKELSDLQFFNLTYLTHQKDGKPNIFQECLLNFLYQRFKEENDTLFFLKELLVLEKIQMYKVIKTTQYDDYNIRCMCNKDGREGKWLNMLRRCYKEIFQKRWLLSWILKRKLSLSEGEWCDWHSLSRKLMFINMFNMQKFQI